MYILKEVDDISMTWRAVGLKWKLIWVKEEHREGGFESNKRQQEEFATILKYTCIIYSKINCL